MLRQPGFEKGFEAKGAAPVPWGHAGRNLRGDPCVAVSFCAWEEMGMWSDGRRLSLGELRVVRGESRARNEKGKKREKLSKVLALVK